MRIDGKNLWKMILSDARFTSDLSYIRERLKVSRIGTYICIYRRAVPRMSTRHPILQKVKINTLHNYTLPVYTSIVWFSVEWHMIILRVICEKITETTFLRYVQNFEMLCFDADCCDTNKMTRYTNEHKLGVYTNDSLSCSIKELNWNLKIERWLFF